MLSVISESIGWLQAITYRCWIPFTLVRAIRFSEAKVIISSVHAKNKIIWTPCLGTFSPMYTRERIPCVLPSSSILIHLIFPSNICILCLLGKIYLVLAPINFTITKLAHLYQGLCALVTTNLDFDQFLVAFRRI